MKPREPRNGLPFFGSIMDQSSLEDELIHSLGLWVLACHQLGKEGREKHFPNGATKLSVISSMASGQEAVNATMASHLLLHCVSSTQDLRDLIAGILSTCGQALRIQNVPAATSARFFEGIGLLCEHAKRLAEELE